MKCILSDGSEHALSVQFLLDIAMGSTPAQHASVNKSKLMTISNSLLKLLAFRRTAVLSDRNERDQLAVKDKSLSMSVTIAQMRNSNYLHRNHPMKGNCHR